MMSSNVTAASREGHSALRQERRKRAHQGRAQLSSRPRFELAAARLGDGRINNAENGRQRQSWR